MDEAILLPSPNWFLVSGLAVTPDGWLIYGSPAKSLSVLEPLTADRSIVVSETGYRTHFFAKVHGDKITSIAVSPIWSEEKNFITGAADGTVKLWNMEKVENAVNIRNIYSHSMHSNEREDVVGVGYGTSNIAVTIGSYGRIIKWDLQSNIVKTYNIIFSRYKPTCIACSPHVSLHVAVGTKQGVVVLLDLSGTGAVLFKVKSHDDEVLSMSWCPQYNSTIMKKVIKDFENKNSANKRMEKIRQEANKEPDEQINDSALSKTLPDDSFDETIVEEEDLFDVYKDHEEEEFGHKKYIPELIVVKEQEEKSKEFDYLAECQKLKDKILQNKDETEPSINSLVEALDKTHVNEIENKSCKGKLKTKKKDKAIENLDGYSKQGQKHLLATIDKYGHLCVWSKMGKLLGTSVVQNKPFLLNKSQLKINQPSWGTLLWYKPNVLLITDAKGQLLQCNPLKTDCRSKLDISFVDTIHKRGTFCIISNAPRVQNPCGVRRSSHVESGNQTHTDSITQDNEKHEYNQEDDLHNNMDSVLPEDQWYVWTAAQDRTLVCYSITKQKKIMTYHSCGGYVYNIQTCPYDAKKVAICVGDGAVRIWETNITEDKEEKLVNGKVTSFWQKVQGKVLVVAWHPTRENILAFGTAESRVGILDISGSNIERPARLLDIGVTGGIYSMCWGERNDLFLCCGGDIIMCNLKKDGEPKMIPVRLDGQKWRVTAVNWCPKGLMCGSFNGSVGLLSNTTYEIQAVSFIFKKLINSVEWHPQYTSNSSEESSLKDLIAVCSMDRCGKIAILKHSQNDDGKHQLERYKDLEGHKGSVLQLAWSPHHEGRLASTSSDTTLRVWEVAAGMCTAIFTANGFSPISLAWNAFPQHSNVLVTGGCDYSVRMWKLEDYPPEVYKEVLPPTFLTKKERRLKSLAERAEGEEYNNKFAKEDAEVECLYGEGREADQIALKLKSSKRFLLPICSKQIKDCSPLTVKLLAEKCVNQSENRGDEDSLTNINTQSIDFFKLFGTTNDLNELLDLEMEQHLEANDTDAWIVLAIFRGQIDTMIQFANENDLLCPFLVSLTPCVSFKYWKDVTQLYYAQINRFVAQKREHKLLQARSYGGPIFRKAVLLLSLHDVKGAVDCLVEGRLFREAYVLCRIRHMESIARDTLQLWVKDVLSDGYIKMAVVCYIVLGELDKASAAIAAEGKQDVTWLSIAVDLAKMAGQHTFACHLEEKKAKIKQAHNNEETEDTLQPLPSRIELLLNTSGAKNDDLGEDLQDEE